VRNHILTDLLKLNSEYDVNWWLRFHELYGTEPGKHMANFDDLEDPELLQEKLEPLPTLRKSHSISSTDPDDSTTASTWASFDSPKPKLNARFSRRHFLRVILDQRLRGRVLLLILVHAFIPHSAHVPRLLLTLPPRIFNSRLIQFVATAIIL
jgi:hypothetical protein